ncbi:MAG: hypothetical protein OEV78_08750 [Spirochaetia bacterium]|nr:hypothetical protein [Spirochaetia bacterium]
MKTGNKILIRLCFLILLGMNIITCKAWGYDEYLEGTGTTTPISISKELKLSGVVTTFAGTTGTMGATNGIGLAASFWNIDGITSDGTNLYIVDYSNNSLRQAAIATATVSTLAGNCFLSSAFGSADGTGCLASFTNPSGITTDGTNLYVADMANQTIRKVVIASGAVTTLAGSAGLTGSADGTGSAARFNFPTGITIDGTNLYVADMGNQTIRKVVISSGAVTTLAGSAGLTGSADGTGSAARFWNPSGITTDGTNLYLTDYSNGTLRKIVIASGVVTTLVGTAGTAGSADGTGPAASFSGPNGITTDGINLYVADKLNSTIRKVVISSGAVTTLAGSAGLTGSVDGTGLAARFFNPNGITTDGVSLFVTDTGNFTIRKIQ